MFSWPRGMWTGVQRTQVLTLGPGQFCTSPKEGQPAWNSHKARVPVSRAGFIPYCLGCNLSLISPFSFLPLSFLVPFPPFFVCLFLFPFFLPNPIILQFLPPYISSSPGRRYHVKFNLYAQHNVYFIITKLSIHWVWIMKTWNQVRTNATPASQLLRLSSPLLSFPLPRPLSGSSPAPPLPHPRLSPSACFFRFLFKLRPPVLSLSVIEPQCVLFLPLNYLCRLRQVTKLFVLNSLFVQWRVLTLPVSRSYYENQM